MSAASNGTVSDGTVSDGRVSDGRVADEISGLPTYLFEQAIAHCASGLIICDARRSHMPIVYASPSFEALTGYTASEAIGRHYLFLKGEDTAQIGLDDIAKAVSGGIGCKVLLRNYHKSGRSFWNELTLSPIKDDAGCVTHYVGTQIDISHYLETFKALQESESRYRHLYEETPAMLHSVDAEGHVINVSQYWLEKLGYQRHEVVGQPISDFLSQTERAQTDQAQTDQVQTDQVQTERAQTNQVQTEQSEAIAPDEASAAMRDVPCHFLKKDGDRIDALLSSIDERISQSNPSAACRTLSVSVDVTERKKVEGNLRRNEALMRAINNLPPTGIFVMDCQTNEALFINSEFYKIWQLEHLQAAVTSGGITGEQLLSECLSNIDLSAFVAASTSEDFSDGTKIVEDEVPLLDGRTLRRIYGPIQENNVTFAYLYVFEDITPRKTAIRQLADATEAAEAANKAKSEFLANMSHELRSPLNAILGFTHILKESNPQPAQKEHLEIIYNSGNHLLALINDILDISKIEAGRVVVAEETFDLIQLLKELQQMFLNAADKKSLALRVERSPHLPKVIRSDRLKLRQILINLLSNAIKFTDEGAITLSVRLAAEAEPQDSHQTSHPAFEQTPEQASEQTPEQTPEQTLFFSVADTGAGIASTDQSRLFEAFVQTESGLTAREGTGLGLTISQEYVQLLGGELAVASTLGEGSVFSFETGVTVVSAADTTTDAHQRKIVGLAPNQPNYRLLVVDDVAVNRKLLTHLLMSVGFDVREATNGKEAIAQWKAWHPHLIWIDMQMPIMTGEEAAREIKALDHLSETKLIALTASAFEENRTAALDSGCDDFVSKPVQAISIFSKMSQHLGVQYRYEACAQSSYETSSHSQETAAVQPLTAQLLAQASHDWRYRLTQATLDLDNAAMLALVQELPAEQNTLAEAVSRCVETLSYKKLLQVLQANECQDAEAFMS